MVLLVIDNRGICHTDKERSKYMNKKRNDKIKNSSVKFIPLILALVVIVLTIGYSATADNLSITGIVAYIRKTEDIRVTGFRYISADNGGTSSNANYGVTSVFADINLPNAESTVTYEVSVTNIGNVEEYIASITGLASNLKYTLDGYDLEVTLCDSNNNANCKNGSVTVFRITVGYADNEYDSSSTSYNFNMKFDFEEQAYTARIGNTKYTTIQAAINAAPKDNTLTTIVLLSNTHERIGIYAGNNIILDMANLVLLNKPGSGVGNPVVEIFGDKAYNSKDITKPVSAQPLGATLTMINGTIITDASQSAINVDNLGVFKMENGTIISNGDRQALYIKAGGLAEISGASHLKAKAVIEGSNHRATVQVITGGNLLIKGGTIESVGGAGIALTNEATTTIGVKDGNISKTNPLIIGSGTGLYIVSGDVNFYDGIIKGKNVAVYNETGITDKEPLYTIVHSTETINSDTYYTAHLGNGVMVRFDATDGTTTEAIRVVESGTEIGQLPTASCPGFVFDGWYTQADGGVLVHATDIITSEVTFYAHWIQVSGDYVAQIGNTQYDTLAEALGAVEGSAPTRIYLLKDVSEYVTVNAGKNIILDMGQNTLSLPPGIVATNIPVIDNKGTITMISGNITTYSTNTAAVNNNSNAKFTITGGSISSTGKRQAIYNNGGTVEIGGTAQLTATAEVASNNKRGTVQNVTAASVLKITGGTITATGSNGIGISNKGTVTVGTQDGTISTTSPVIIGVGNGIYNEKTLNFYDGIVKSISTPLAGNGTRNIENNSEEVNDTETIDNQTYHTFYLRSTN